MATQSTELNGGHEGPDWLLTYWQAAVLWSKSISVENEQGEMRMADLRGDMEMEVCLAMAVRCDAMV